MQIPASSNSLGIEDYSQRKAVDVALHLLKGAAYLQRVNQLKLQSVSLEIVKLFT